jgi:dihydroneopterin aldolase
MDRIIITGVSATGFHGVLPEERRASQVFSVDCELQLNLRPAIKSDELSKTINYIEVALLIREIIEGPELNLIEALAGKIADAIMKRYRKVQRVVITVHKPQAPIPVDFLDVAVAVERKR